MTLPRSLVAAIDEFIAPAAAEVDRTGHFPRRQIEALAEAGLLGLTVPDRFGGRGRTLREAADVVRALAAVCPSTASVVATHFAATAVLVATDRDETLADIARGTHVSTLAISEAGSRGSLWAPVGTATVDGNGVVLEARKSWVMSAGEADSYVWASGPLAAHDRPMTLWQVPAGADGLRVGAPLDGLGLRGAAAAPVAADGVRVSRDDMLGRDGAGLDLVVSAVLPVLLVLNASLAVGIMRRLADEAVTHLQKTRLDHLGQTLARQPAPRTQLARLRIEADRGRALVDETLAALEADRDDAGLLVLEVKAAASEGAADVADLALRMFGAAALRRGSVIERLFRDSRAARALPPTTEVLHDLVGRTLCDLPLVGDA